MKYLGFDDYEFEFGEPGFRSCWNCNSLHEYLKNKTYLHVCFLCDRYWIHGRFLDEFKSAETLDAFLKDKLEGGS